MILHTTQLASAARAYFLSVGVASVYSLPPMVTAPGTLRSVATNAAFRKVSEEIHGSDGWRLRGMPAKRGGVGGSTPAAIAAATAGSNTMCSPRRPTHTDTHTHTDQRP
jgi:hypothetical protein